MNQGIIALIVLTAIAVICLTALGTGPSGVEVTSEDVGFHEELVLKVVGFGGYQGYVDLWVYSTSPYLNFTAPSPVEYAERITGNSAHFFINRLDNQTLTLFPIANEGGDFLVYINYSWQDQEEYSSKTVTVHARPVRPTANTINFTIYS